MLMRPIKALKQTLHRPVLSELASSHMVVCSYPLQALMVPPNTS